MQHALVSRACRHFYCTLKVCVFHPTRACLFRWITYIFPVICLLILFLLLYVGLDLVALVCVV